MHFNEKVDVIATLESATVQVETETSASQKVTYPIQTGETTSCVVSISRSSTSRGRPELNISVSNCDIVLVGASTKLKVEHYDVVINESAEEDEGNNHRSLEISVPRQMSTIPKRGSLNTAWYDSLLARLNKLQDIGDFQKHDQIVQINEVLYSEKNDMDLVCSMHIMRAKALYYQNNLKKSKQILKNVINDELKLKNPGVLVGRALVLLVAVYKRQKRFGRAMECVERAKKHLLSQNSADDLAELHYSYGALITAMPPGKKTQSHAMTRQEAHKAHEMACSVTESDSFRDYVLVRRAEMLLQGLSKSEGTPPTSVKKQRVLQAKELLDSVEHGRSTGEMDLGTRIVLLALRSDQLLHEGRPTMASERAVQACNLITRHGFELEFGPIKRRLELALSTQIKLSNSKVDDNYSDGDQ